MLIRFDSLLQLAINGVALRLIIGLMSISLIENYALAAEADSSRQSGKISLGETLRRTVIFLYEDHTPPNSSDLTPGRVLGTAFIVGIPHSKLEKFSIPAIVTAKHVIAQRSTILARYSLKKGDATAFVRYDLSLLRRNGDFWEHPDEGVDIVAFRTPFFDQTLFEAVPISIIASREVFTKEGIGVNDPVVIPALLQNYPGTTQNYPLFRNGSIALVTEEPIEITWKMEGKVIKSKQQVVFVNSTFNEGFSGAPVFVWPSIRITPEGTKTGGNAFLIGIVHGFQPQYRPVIDEDGEDVYVVKPSKEPPDLNKPQLPRRVLVSSQENSATGLIFPSWELLKIIQSKEVQNRLQQLSDTETKTINR